jgi:DNA mismatch endonuclease (patch repair protein)
MVDRLTPERRSWLMSRVKSWDTTAELRVRRLAYALGLRYRLHRADLPGKPDIVFPGRKIALFVHGCFWHRHPGCPKTSTPKSNLAFWNEKFEANVARDARSVAALKKLGWKPLVIWECQTKDTRQLERILRKRLLKDARTSRH